MSCNEASQNLNFCFFLSRVVEQFQCRKIGWKLKEKVLEQNWQRPFWKACENPAELMYEGHTETVVLDLDTVDKLVRNAKYKMLLQPQTQPGWHNISLQKHMCVSQGHWI